MTAFRAFQIAKAADVVTGRVIDATLDSLSAGEVVVKVAYSSVNFKDARVASGHPRFPRDIPVIGGIDLSGTVVTSADARFHAGDEVLATGYELGVTHDGGFSGYARLPGDWLVPLPAGLSLFDAMALGTAGFTAALSIVEAEHDGLAPGNGPVVVTGATGGVGSVAVDILAQRGYAATAVTGKDDQHDYLRRLGAQAVLPRAAAAATREPLGAAQWAGAIDPVGGDTLAWLTKTTAYRGVITNCGLTGGADLVTSVAPFILRGIKLLGIDSVYCPAPLRHAVWQRLATDLRPRHLAAVVTEVGLDGIAETVTSLLAGRVRGRTVVRLP